MTSHSDCCQAIFIYMRKEKEERNECEACLPSRLKNEGNAPNLEDLFCGNCGFLFAESEQNYLGVWVLARASMNFDAKTEKKSQ